MSRWAVLRAAAAALSLTACSGEKAHAFSDSSTGLSFRYPRGWTVSGFSTTVSPPRLIVASYRVRSKEVEGDCRGSAALPRLPRDGVAVLLIDYGTARNFPRHPPAFRVAQFQRGDSECFGPSYTLRFRRGNRDIQAHVAVGPIAHVPTRRQALAVLDSLKGHS